MYLSYESQKLRFEKVTSSPVPVVGNGTVKNKEIALKLCMHIVCMCLHNMFSGFLITWKFWILWEIMLENENFDFSGQNENEKSEITIYPRIYLPEGGRIYPTPERGAC